MPKYYGETVDIAIEKGLSALKLSKEDVKIQIVDEGKKGFLGFGKKEAEVSIEAIKKAAPVKEPEKKAAVSKAVEVISSEEITSDLENLDDEEALKELAMYLTKVTKEIGAPALVKIERDNSLIIFHLDTEKQGILIGKHGKILNALQYLSQVFIHRKAKNKISVVVNVGNYREKRKEILERLALKTADRVKRTGQPVFLEPMPAFERKQVHAALTKNPYVKTHSEGEEPYRYLVVEPEKNVL